MNVENTLQKYFVIKTTLIEMPNDVLPMHGNRAEWQNVYVFTVVTFRIFILNHKIVEFTKIIYLQNPLQCVKLCKIPHFHGIT